MQLGTKMNGLSTNEDLKDETPTSTQGKMQLFPQADHSSDDFLLTAQGGLKGTSKPMYYRVRLNENKIWGPQGGTPLTKEDIERCTYQMSFMVSSINGMASIEL